MDGQGGEADPHLAYPVGAFFSGRARSSVLGIRPSALIWCRVPGPRCQIAGPPARSSVSGPRPWRV